MSCVHVCVCVIEWFSTIIYMVDSLYGILDAIYPSCNVFVDQAKVWRAKLLSAIKSLVLLFRRGFQGNWANLPPEMQWMANAAAAAGDAKLN